MELIGMKTNMHIRVYACPYYKEMYEYATYNTVGELIDALPSIIELYLQDTTKSIDIKNNRSLHRMEIIKRREIEKFYAFCINYHKHKDTVYHERIAIEYYRGSHTIPALLEQTLKSFIQQTEERQCKPN